MPDGGSDILTELVNLAHQFQQEGKLDEAGAVCARIVAATPQPKSPVERLARAEAMNFLAVAAANRNQMGTAIDFFYDAIRMGGSAHQITTYRMNLVRVLLQIGWKERARHEVESAVRMAPASAKTESLRLRALVAREQTDAELALQYYKQAAESEPDNQAALLEYAAILADTGQLEESLEIYQSLVDSEQYRAVAIQGCGLCLMRMMRCAEAIEHFNEALALDPGMTMAQWNRSLSYLTLGNFLDGWRDHEARFHLGVMASAGVGTPAKRFARPFWDGKPASDGGLKRIHLHVEQGLGDTLQFCRYAHVVRDMGHDVRLECNHELFELLEYSFPGVAVVPQASDWPGGWGLDEFDFHMPLMSLPRVLRTTADTIPYGDRPYLKAHPDKVMDWAMRLKDLPHPRVGICWHGRSRDALWVRELDRRRSLSFDQTMELFRSFPGMQFVSLHIDGNEQHPQLLRFDEHLKSFADTAALIENLDLVIAVDTSVLHLAAGLGKPTWMLNRWDSCWRWSEPFGDRSPWYPTLRIFKQETLGDWTPVIERVVRELEALDVLPVAS